MPKPTTKISISHINQVFNDEVQIDVTFCRINKKQFPVLHVVDTSTAYSEGSIITERARIALISPFDSDWLFRHGAPLFVSGDDEFNKAVIKKSLAYRSIEFKLHPT